MNQKLKSKNSSQQFKIEESKQDIRYKFISGRLKEHFGYKLSVEGNIINGNNVCCIHCDKSFAYHGSNTSLIYHIQNMHPAQYQKLQLKKSVSFNNLMAASSSKQTKMSQFLNHSDLPVSATIQRDLKILLASWIATSGRPISIVEDNGLQKVLRRALQNDAYKLPGRRTIDKVLNEMYNDKYVSVKEAVKKSTAIALTSDFWTSLSNESYCGITGHWITDEWNLQSIVLECVNVIERHYSNYVTELYNHFTEEWDIRKKIKAIVTDNARNIVSAVNQSGFPHIPCIAHTMQLSILYGFKAADTEILFGKCRKIVGHFKHSAANTTELQNCSESLLYKLQQDVPTRWNSIFLMLQSLLQAKEAINVYISQKGKQYKGSKLLDTEWEKISKYVDVLDLFCQAMVLLGGQQYVSCSVVLPLLSSLTNHMTVNDDDPGYIARFKTAAIDDFKERISDITNIETLQIATALDPRYKNLKCLSEYSKNQTWSLIQQQISESSDNSDANIYSINETICKPISKRIKLMESDSDSEEGFESAADELHRYKNEKKVAESVCPLQWWKLNQHRYPKLSLIAKNFLCIPATSVPCERLFSSAGYIVNKTRSSLEPDTVNMLVCLRSWLSDDN